MCKVLAYSVFWLFGGICFAQGLTKEIEEVTVVVSSSLPNQNLNQQSISQDDIRISQPEDVGQVLQKFAGISLKSYGGLGGLKTFSFRGIGSQHTAVLIDDFLQQNAQVGQVNLGSVQASNLESVQLGNGNFDRLTQISALTSGTVLSIATMESQMSRKSFQLNFQSKYGSFAQQDQYLSLRLRKNRWGMSAFGNYRTFEGRYPFALKFGDYTYSGTRRNNHLEENRIGGYLFYQPKKGGPIRLGVKFQSIDQGLPGAVVLFNNLNKQYLSTEQGSIALDWQGRWKKALIRPYASYVKNYLFYQDSSYLNASNYYSSKFSQESMNLGVSLERNFRSDSSSFYGGAEFVINQLTFMENARSAVSRQNAVGVVGYKTSWEKSSLDVRSGLQYVRELHFLGNKVKERYIPNASVQWTANEKEGRHWRMGVLGIYSTRLPSFSELFYSQIGPKSLQPESVLQIQPSIEWRKKKEKKILTFRIQPYFNNIRNKLVAIPTKNLFVWSVQNVGRVNSMGVDQLMSASWNAKKNWRLTVTENYSFQAAIDRTDPNGPTYNHQIAYIPLHTVNLEPTVEYKKFGLRTSFFFTDKRYALNENTIQNSVPGFSTLDLSLFYSVQLKNQHSLRLQFNCKNATNEQFVFVRSYAMPGRNYLLSLNYAF